ncbi:ankyrin [Aaosphaeria arxii CBS 175.79]|uniref:Ankyrin n=1 Tax=Aaosphaeria arxii CBS 175.79 TaxID=1450172 RepID=A0A6A5XQ27_9PLEO|nr:ankyrin [Aaosphaeria arxii CBS 175.79]KAF2014999.1 ankyrin [Aaosphaeria arxii CBS 175.79]
MDPISTSASIITVLTAATGTCKFLYDLILDIKDAPKEIQIQRKKLQHLQVSMEHLLKASARLPKGYQLNSTHHGMVAFMRDIEEIQDYLDRRAQASARRGVSRAKESFKWLFDRRLRKFFDNLEHYDLIFGQAVRTVEFSMLSKIMEQTSPVARPCCEVSSETCRKYGSAFTVSAIPTKHDKASIHTFIDSSKLHQALRSLSEMVFPVGLLLRYRNHVSIPTALRLELEGGPAICRRWSPKGQQYYTSSGFTISLAVRFSRLFHTRLAVVLFFVHNSSCMGGFTLKCNPSISIILPWDHSAFKAVETGDIDAIRQRISSGALNLNSTNPGGCTLLHYAVRFNQADILLLLQSCGADVNKANFQGETPLHVSIRRGRDHECTCRLLALGADLCQPDSSGRSALHTFYNSITAYVFQYHLDDIDTWAQDSNGMTVLHYLSWSRRSHPQELLRCDGVDNFSTTRRSPSHATSQLAIKDRQGKSMLHYATRRGNLDLICTLLQRPDAASLSMPDYQGRSLLHYATESSRTEVIDVFLTRGVDINVVDSQGRNALHHACMWGNEIAVKHLVGLEFAHLLDAVDNDGKTPIMVASHYRSHSVLQYLSGMRQVPAPIVESDLVGLADSFHWRRSMLQSWMKYRNSCIAWSMCLLVLCGLLLLVMTFHERGCETHIRGK